MRKFLTYIIAVALLTTMVLVIMKKNNQKGPFLRVLTVKSKGPTETDSTESEDDLTSQCSFHGVIVDKKCECYKGFSGESCETLDDCNCKNGVTVYNDNYEKPPDSPCLCECYRGFAGEACSIKKENAKKSSSRASPDAGN